ncbi:HET-domain-containing protein [Lepidopterella palustris CBS 459.81]|uniref:HET-domain-containing protein n=1 Tax=Lepidopterella palustris CBS 459.81 TaxID=1314670 RepID=A0A8E2J992_9PEZI|nr:HET-domain-containing protein [Lepidopterella palustris CBS 459.81]
MRINYDKELQDDVIRSNNYTSYLARKPCHPKDAFNYPRLSHDEKTRLIILEPGEPEDDLQCHIKHVHSLQDQEYEALSYAWSEESKEHSIVCSGRKLRLTANLDAALRQLRFVDGVRVLWVDAICINQNDEAEKSRQVRIMQEIYANAKQVVVWLGSGTEQDDRALGCLKNISTRMGGEYASRFLARLGWYRARSGRIFSGGAHKPMITDMEYEHLITLLRREWFCRTWIVQEVASSKSAIVYCGSQSILWETLATVYMGLGDHFIPVSQLGGEDAHHSLENITAIETARRSQRGPLPMSLFHILVTTSRSKCKDQRDKIFAVIGLAKDWMERAIILPDYNKGGEEREVLKTFKAFAVADIIHYKHLRALSCASGPRATSPLPSWVHDWRTLQNSHPFTRYSDRTKFCASGCTKPEAWFSTDNTILHVVGKQVDSIDVLGREPTFTKTIAVFEINMPKISEIKQSYRWLQECQDLSRDAHGTLTTERYSELCRTLTCGLTDEAFPMPAQYPEYFAKYFDFMSSASERFQEYLLEAQTTVHGIRGLDESIPHFREFAVVEASLDRWSSTRRFSVTRKGRLACVPKDSEEGDVICILFGGEVPYVLRPTSDGFHAVVGECYVDGIMHGESLSYATASREFRLR